ncbi:hypothetical protein [Xanthomonas campestris]|uniref:hypothetical protein n=1 Tax=Xanthomonas campestris TaxID=339 RepID=UPI0023EA3366|nr:hypothetical protein [Xanthomonas campestris]
MLRSLRHHRVLQSLAVLAVALMLVAPLISRWCQLPLAQPMCTSQAAGAAASAHGARHPMPGMGAAQHHVMDALAFHHAAPAQDAGAHADACDYCVLAARLLGALALVVLCLLQLRPSKPAAPTPTHAWHALRWPALGARGPPLAA